MLRGEECLMTQHDRSVTLQFCTLARVKVSQSEHRGREVTLLHENNLFLQIYQDFTFTMVSPN